MARFTQEKQGVDPSFNPSLELMNLDSSCPQNLILFSNGALLDDDHNPSQFPFNFTGGNGEKFKIDDNEKRRKQKRNKQAMNIQKPKDVVHVRAKRGQATDSHSLAERARREKINERLRFLQDLVPGCYKTMGMAVMLDVIINYVRNLQNQIEFLSTKLSVASEYNHLSMLETEPMEILNGTGFYDYAQETVMGGESQWGQPRHFTSTWPL